MRGRLPETAAFAEPAGRAPQRMIAAGANVMTWLAVAAEWQRDRARAEQAAGLTGVITQHAGGSGIAFLWEQQRLNTPVPGTARSS